MLPWCKMNDEELEAVTGGVTPNFASKEIPIIPIPAPGKGIITTQIILY